MTEPKMVEPGWSSPVLEIDTNERIAAVVSANTDTVWVREDAYRSIAIGLRFQASIGNDTWFDLQFEKNSSPVYVKQDNVFHICHTGTYWMVTEPLLTPCCMARLALIYVIGGKVTPEPHAVLMKVGLGSVTREDLEWIRRKRQEEGDL